MSTLLSMVHEGKPIFLSDSDKQAITLDAKKESALLDLLVCRQCLVNAL